jgi:hypothetical protein
MSNLKTGIKGRGTYLKGWSRLRPNLKQKTVMLKKCGKKCFLGTKKSFPICIKNTCKKNRKGIHAAYVRSREYESIFGTRNKRQNSYKAISRKAYKMLYK